MNKGEFWDAFHRKYGWKIKHRFSCGREAVFDPLQPLPKRRHEPLEELERAPLRIFERVGDWYISGIDRFKTRPGYLLPHAYVSVDKENGTITIYAESPKKREVLVYTLGEENE